MDRDELEEDDLEEEEVPTEDSVNDEPVEDDTANELPPSPDSGEIANPTPSSLIQKILFLWKKLPPAAKASIAGVVYHILVIAGFIIMLVIAIAAVAAISEGLWENFHEENGFIEKIGNLFTGKGYVTDETYAEEQEKKYYQKLSDVYDFYLKNYGVEIDTTLISATLFYGRGMSDYIDDKETLEMEEADLANDENIFQSTGDFYKVAKRHIKTLAKYQIVENTSYNTCPDIEEPQSITTPASDKEVADTWVGFYGWNTRATFNYQAYKEVSYPMIDGTARTIKYCEYKNAESQLSKAYQDDYDIYKKANDEYNACVSRCENEIQIVEIDGELKVVHTCDPDSRCIREKAKSEEYYSNLNSNWGDVFDINTGAFQCFSSNTWGRNLSYYTDSIFYKNYSFPEDWINRTTEPGFWAEYGAALLGQMNPIGCSAKPSIEIHYEAEINREGVYYYKLLSRNTEFLSNKNFIERYYPNYVDSNDSDQALKDSIEIVEKIYDVYEYAIQNRQYCTVLSGSGNSYYSENTNEFVSMIADIAVGDMQKTGVLASVTIAQAILESRNGNSGLATKYNNYYGETAGSCAGGIDTNIRGAVAPGTHGNNCSVSANEYWDGTVARMCNSEGKDCQWYRVYNSFENSTYDHSQTFLRKNFSYCDSKLTDPLSYVTCLEERENHKYATDPDYVNKIMSVINTYNLTQYDIGTPSPTVVANTTNLVTASSTANESLAGWLFVGDSYTDYLRGGGESWKTDYSSIEGFSVFAEAGNTTKQIYQNLQSGSVGRDTLPSSAKRIVVLAGINDIIKEGRPGYESIPLYDTATQSVTGTGYMKQIIEFLQNKYPNTPIFIQKVFPTVSWLLSGSDAESGDNNRLWRGSIATVDVLNSKYEALAAKYKNVTVIDTRSGFLDTSGGGMLNEKSADGLHISPDYYDDWVENIKTSISSAGGFSGNTGSTTLTSANSNCIPWSGSTGTGTISGNGAQGIRTSLPRNSSEYITYWGSANNLYYRSSVKLVNECTWYAHGRGLEILTKNGMSMTQAQTYMNPMAHNAGTWYNDNQYFSSSQDYTKPKVGAIVVWSNGNKPGHVAIIEDIKYDANGNITSISTSEGGQSIGGFRYTEGRTLEYMRAHGTYRFVGYIYLLD